MTSLIDSDTRIKVSSTLDKSVGKRYLTDRSPETCWTSAQGLPQSVQVTFSRDSLPSGLFMTFQGGFVGTRCAVQVQSAEGQWETKQNVYPEDVNRRQIFELDLGDVPIRTLKLVFEQSSDFFGRITIYDLDILGKEYTIEQSV